MCLRKKFCLFLVGCSSFFVATAQNSAKTEQREIYFRIDNAFKYGDSMYVFADGASDIEVKRGMPVNAFRTLSKEIPKRIDFRQVGSGRVSRADSVIIFFIKLFIGFDTLAAGDELSIQLHLTLFPVRTTLS